MRFGSVAVVAVALLGVLTTDVHASAVSGAGSCADTATTGSDAMALARACARPVEVTGARTATDTVFAQPDGLWRLERRSRPVRIQRPDGGWAPIDTTLRPAPDGSVVPGATSVGLAFSGGGTGPLVRLDYGGRRLEVGSPFGALPAPVLEGNSARYPEVLPGVDLRVTADGEGYTEVLVLKSREAAVHPALRRISFPFAGPGLRTTVDAANNVRVVDGAGNVVFGGSAPSMWDSAEPHTDGSQAHTDGSHAEHQEGRHGKRMPIDVASVAGVAHLSVTPSQEFLMDPATVYPVMIDPPITRYKLAWTYVSQDCGGCTFWNSSDLAQTGPIDGHTHISYFRMSMADLQYRTNIVSASFVIDLKWTYASWWKETELFEVTPISTSTSWNNRPGKNASLGIVTVNAPQDGIAWGVTDRLRYAASQGWPDWTLGLFSLNDTDRAYGKRWSNNPALVVFYNDPPSTPTPRPLSECRTQCTSPAIVRTRTPTLPATVADPNGGQVRGDFEVRAAPSDSAALLASTTTGPVSSGLTAQWTVPSGVLSDATYYWRVRARDEIDWVSGWTAWQTLTIDTDQPIEPSVTSAEYPDNGWGPPVGTQGRFTFTHQPPAGDSDVVAFGWWVDGGVTNFAAASTPAGCTTSCAAVATVQYTPTRDMTHYLYVYGIDRAGNTSFSNWYRIRVSPVANRCWRWLLNETSGTIAPDTGNTDATDDICGPIGSSITPQDGWLLGGASWAGEAAGPRDRFARFDGVSGEIYSRSILDATKSFTVMAWVRPADLAVSNGNQNLISQPGEQVDRFALRYSKDANGGAGGWCFDMNSADAVGTRTSACATGTVGDSGLPTVGRWVHLAGVYDAASGQIQIHVMGNQDSCNGEMVSADVTGSWTSGPPYFEIGLSYSGWENSQLFKGDIDHVYAFQRALAPSEICRQVQ